MKEGDRVRIVRPDHPYHQHLIDQCATVRGYPTIASDDPMVGIETDFEDAEGHSGFILREHCLEPLRREGK